MSHVRVRLFDNKSGSLEGTVLLSRIPCVGEEIVIEGGREVKQFRVLRVRHSVSTELPTTTSAFTGSAIVEGVPYTEP